MLENQTEKMNEMEDDMNCNKIDVMATNEMEIHGKNSRVIRSNPANVDVLKHNLHLEGYSFWVPKQNCQLPKRFHTLNQIQMLGNLKRLEQFRSDVFHSSNSP